MIQILIVDHNSIADRFHIFALVCTVFAKQKQSSILEVPCFIEKKCHAHEIYFIFIPIKKSIFVPGAHIRIFHFMISQCLIVSCEQFFCEITFFNQQAKKEIFYLFIEIEQITIICFMMIHFIIIPFKTSVVLFDVCINHLIHFGELFCC